MGAGKLSLKGRPTDMPSKQAAAAVGQCELMYAYDRLFSQHNHTVAQLLLTGSDIEDEKRRANFHNTMFRLLELGALPVINENDTVATEEIEFGDNDTLSALVAELVGADALVQLTDIDGLYDADPHQNPDAHPIPEVRIIDQNLLKLAGGAGSNRGTGGMVTKLHAAEIAMAAGIPAVIMNGARPSRLYDLMEGQALGTLFVPHSNSQPS